MGGVIGQIGIEEIGDGIERDREIETYRRIEREIEINQLKE